ncbi:hypothetical protein TNCV_519961 [Trichonephila clavipes]|nr:hypothetical protein TNCV_519961 [Trichonephila clavipes]
MKQRNRAKTPSSFNCQPHMCQSQGTLPGENTTLIRTISLAQGSLLTDSMTSRMFYSPFKETPAKQPFYDCLGLASVWTGLTYAPNTSFVAQDHVPQLLLAEKFIFQSGVWKLLPQFF